VIQQQELDHTAASLSCLDAVGADDHAVLNLLDAGWERLRCALNVYETHSALGRRAQPRVVTVPRDDYAKPLGGIEDRRTLGHRELGTVDRDIV
jgi:hypothetical protein